MLTIHLDHDLKKSVLFDPSTPLKKVLEKICLTRKDMALETMVPRDMAGNDLDMQLTLGQLGLTDIDFSGETFRLHV